MQDSIEFESTVLHFLFIESLINNDSNQIITDISCFYCQIRGHFGEVLKPVSAFHSNLIHVQYLCLAV